MRVWLDEKTIKQVGVVPFLKQNGQVRYVSITSTTTGEWIFPKGQIDSLLPLWEIAENEAFEEAGVLGDIVLHTPIAHYRDERRDIHRHIELYPLEVHTVLPSWSEQRVRERMIESYDVIMHNLMLEAQGAFDVSHCWIQQHS